MKSLIILLVILYLLYELYTRDGRDLSILSLAFTGICTFVLVYGGFFLILMTLSD